MKPDFYRLMADIAVKKLARAGHRAPQGFSLAKQQSVVYAEGGVNVAKNPLSVKKNSTPQTFSEMFDTQPFFLSFFGVNKSKDAASPAQKMFESFRGTIGSLNTLFFAKLGWNGNKFSYPENASLDQQKEIVLNQYKRYVLTGVEMAILQIVYKITPAQLDAIVEAMGLKTMTKDQLNDKATRLEFGKQFNRIMMDMVGSQDLGGAVLAKIKAGRS